MSDDLPVLCCATRDELAVWLEAHAGGSRGVWLQLARKDGGASTVTYAEAVELGLVYGWIDGQRRSLDAEHWLQRFTPRGPRSRWSVINRDKAIGLIDAGTMKPSGLAAVERARMNGSWERAYAGARTITVPEDLQCALDAEPAAAAFFASLDGTNRYAVLYRIGEAKKPDTRARRIETFVGMLARGQKLHP